MEGWTTNTRSLPTKRVLNTGKCVSCLFLLSFSGYILLFHSFDKVTSCKSLWSKLSAKCPQCKFKCNRSACFQCLRETELLLAFGEINIVGFGDIGICWNRITAESKSLPHVCLFVCLFVLVPLLPQWRLKLVVALLQI